MTWHNMLAYLSKYFLAENNILSSFELAWPWSIGWDSHGSHLMRQTNISSCDVQLIYNRNNDQHNHSL